jgi:hypothetical protein
MYKGLPMLFMKRAVWGGLLVFSIGAGFLSGCEQGSCENITCLNGGTCRNGRCQCPVGFEGVRCETKWTDRWIGTYTVDDRCRRVGLIPQYEGRVSPSTIYPDVVYLEPFGNLTCDGGQAVKVEGRLLSGKEIRIEQQAVCSRRYSIAGDGTYDGNRRAFTITYTIRDFQTGLTDTCTATWLKY